jgi:hypothetical protein
MRRWFSVVAGVLALIVSIASVSLPAATEPRGGEVMQPAPPVHPMKKLWRDIDELNFEVDQIQVYDRYCKPPNDPQIADTQLDITSAAVKYRALQRQFDRMHEAFEEAIKTRLSASYRSSYPTLDGLTADNRDYWARTSGMLSALNHRIDALQKKLDGKKEVDCAKTTRQPPPPPPQPPVDWLTGLERPVAVPMSPDELPTRFCSELEKTRWILAHIDPLRIQAAENARFASYYVVDVGAPMRDLETKGIFGALTVDERRGLKELREEYKWAQDNLAEQDRVAERMNALRQKAQATPVVECEQRQQDTALSQPSYEPTGPMELPNRFCSQAQKDAFLKEASAKKVAAERNYDKANAKVAEFADRIGKGDGSKATSDAFQAASKAASDYFQLILGLDAVLSQAHAMPVVDCTRAAQAIDGLESGPRGPSVPDDGKEPPNLKLPAPEPKGEKSVGRYADERPVIASRPRGADGALTVSAGYTETDMPQQTFGRIVIGGSDFAMALSPGVLEGFRGEMEYDLPVLSGDRRTSLAFGLELTDVDGSETRQIVNDVGVSSGFVWIDPLDPTTPVAVGLAGAGLTWDTHVSSSSAGVFGKALYQYHYPLATRLTGTFGVGLAAGYQETEHRSSLVNVDFAGFNVYKNYDFSTFSIGPRFEGALDWECEPDGLIDGALLFKARLAAHVGPSYDVRSLDASQRAMSPVPFAFDHSQRVDLDDDGFNFRYGIEGSAGLEFGRGTELFVKAGWQGETDAPTIRPADGSFAPGAPIRLDTDNASQWYVQVGVRFEF